jgi:hypothetical protein
MGSLFRSLTVKNLPERQIWFVHQPTSTRPIIRLVEDNDIQGLVEVI